MAIPGFQDFMLPVIRIAEELGPIHKSRYDDIIADRLGLTTEDRSELLPSGGQTTYQNRIGWAVSYLTKALVLERPARATVQITDRGRSLLADAPERVDLAYLMRYPEFKKYRETYRTRSSQVDELVEDEEDISPMEQLEKAYTRLRNELASELLDLVMKAPPEFFERLVVEVLVAMGYGGTLKDAGTAVGKTNDGGIDGVIKEDRLGLDSIYIQAKRWENPVQRPVLQGFAGALMGQNASRGVFITSSDFTSGARDYVKSINTKIVLINGQELADLMIEYGVGVIDEQTYRVKRVDPEYFGE